MDTKTLEGIGLTKNESIVYLTLLKTGTSKTGRILNSSGLNSGKIYEILESLKKKGLVSESIINNIKLFSAAPPLQILKWLDIKKEEIISEEEAIKKELPQLDMLRKEGVKEVKAVTYTGFEGIKTAAYEALNSTKHGEEILAMGVTEMKHKKFNDFWIKYAADRAKGKHLTKFLFSEQSQYYTKTKKLPLVEAKHLEGITPTTIDIFGKDKVLILNYQEPSSCILIYDENTAASFTNFFYQLWKIAKS